MVLRGTQCDLVYILAYLKLIISCNVLKLTAQIIWVTELLLCHFMSCENPCDTFININRKHLKWNHYMVVGIIVWKPMNFELILVVMTQRSAASLPTLLNALSCDPYCQWAYLILSWVVWFAMSQSHLFPHIRNHLPLPPANGNFIFP